MNSIHFKLYIIVRVFFYFSYHIIISHVNYFFIVKALDFNLSQPNVVTATK